MSDTVDLWSRLHRNPLIETSRHESSAAQDAHQSSYIYAVGSIGFDFGKEARRDSFAEDMRLARIFESSNYVGTADAGPDPDDPYQLGHYLLDHPWAVDRVAWTLIMDRGAIYALEPEPAARASWGSALTMPAVYSTFTTAIIGQAERKDGDTYISRVSLAANMTTRNVRLLSGQIVPVVEVRAQGGAPDLDLGVAAQSSRPKADIWREKAIVDAAVSGLFDGEQDAKRLRAMFSVEGVEDVVRALLAKTYATLRNHGQAPGDRALNYLGTDLVHSPKKIRKALLSGWVVNDVRFRTDPSPDEVALFTLDRVVVSKSPVDRLNSDCWDVTLTLFNPRSSDRAKMCYLYTVDVSDQLPVVLPRVYQFVAAR